MPNSLDDYLWCTKCRKSLEELMCLALLKDMGTGVEDPLVCEHDFIKGPRARDKEAVRAFFVQQGWSNAAA